MNKILNSKLVSVFALLIVVVVIIVTFKARQQWWMFIDVFCAFMGVFCHLAAQLFERFGTSASRKLDVAAAIFLILFVIAFVVEFILVQTIG